MRYTSYGGSILCFFLLIVFVGTGARHIFQLLDAAKYLQQQVTCTEQAACGRHEVISVDGHSPQVLQDNQELLVQLRGYLPLQAAKPQSVSTPQTVLSAQMLAAVGVVHSAVADEIGAGLSRLIWGSAALLLTAFALGGLPMIAQHRKSIRLISASRRRTQRQAEQLRAVHTTIGNMLEDISHQRKKTSRAAEINARLAAVINSADDAILSLNLAGYVATANLAANRLFGRSCEGERFTDLFPAQAAAQLRASLMVTEEQNSGSTIDVNMQRKQQRLDLSLTISPIRGDDYQPSGFSVIAKDVSNSKLEEERFRLAVEAAPNAMIMIDSRGVIVLFNSEAERMFGYRRDELTGQAIDVLLPLQLRSDHARHVQSFVAAPSRRKMGRGAAPLNGLRSDGEQFPIEVGLTPINIDGETYVISSIVDMSERIAQQKSLTDLNQELSRKNQEMEQFIYTVSHDLKAPLVTIAGFANRLRQAKDLQLPAAHMHKIERIIANVKSMEALLQDLLHLSRVIKLDLKKSHINVSDSLDHVFNSLDGMIRKSGAAIAVDSPLAPVYAQESLLFQCLQNIISNAIKYTAPGTTPTIKIHSAQQPGFTGITICDSGVGIAPQYHERIFNVFERLDPDVCEGTGVGLSIVKTIMEKHSGKIEFTSAPGEGTCFTLLFPESTTTIEDHEHAHTHR